MFYVFGSCFTTRLAVILASDFSAKIRYAINKGHFRASVYRNHPQILILSMSPVKLRNDSVLRLLIHHSVETRT